MKKILERYPFFLVLLPAFVIIHFEKEFHGVIQYQFIYDRIIILFAVPQLCFAVIWFFSRSVLKSSLSAFALMLVFYYTGELKNWLSELFPESVWQSYTFLFSAFLFLFVALLFVIRKNRYNLRRPCFVINIALLLFIAADIFQILFTTPKSRYNVVSEAEIKNNRCDSCIKPDIYYIIFDAYSSSRFLLSEYGYSNAPIEENLKAKGFAIIPASRSNYNYTAFSIGSTLNMNYLNGVDTVTETTDRTYMQALNLVKKNRVVSFLEKENYRIFNHSIFDIDSYPTTVRGIDFWGFRELIDQYNLLFKLHQDIGYRFPLWMAKFFKNRYSVGSKENKSRLGSAVYEHLLESVKLETSQPKFVYAHFLKPHPPFFHDSLGHPFNTELVPRRDAYIHQIAYCNTIMKKITDSIITNTRRPLVIVIQGDHAFSFLDMVNMQKKFLNFSAVYYSNKNYNLFNDSTTSVNTFRIVLNTYFNKDLKLLPDKFYLLHQ